MYILRNSAIVVSIAFIRLAGTWPSGGNDRLFGGNSYLISPLIDSLTATDNQVVLGHQRPVGR